MELLLKIFKIIAIIILLLFLALVSVTLIKQDKVASIFLNELNKNINTKVEVGSSKLSLFRKFPMASFEFKNILIHPSSGFSKGQFSEIDTDTLLYARMLSLEFKMTDLYKSRYIIESISITDGILTILSDSIGRSNYEITTDSLRSSENEFALDLKNIALTDVEVYYINKAISLKIKSRLKSGKLKGEIAGNNIDLYAKSDAIVTSLQLYGTKVNYPTDIQFEINMHKSEKGILFNKGSLSFENIALDLSGTISDKNIIDLSLTGKSSNISGLKNYLSGRYLKIFEDYKPSGVLKVDCEITGLVSRTSSPHFNINFTLNEGLVEYSRSKISAEKISFSGTYDNGTRNNPETGILMINNFLFNIGNNNYSGNFSLRNFLNPYVDLQMHGVLEFNDLKEFIPIPQLSSSEGSVDVSIRLSGNLENKEKYSISDFLKLNPEANLDFNSLSIGLKGEKIRFEAIDGNIKYSNTLWADNLSVTFRDQKIKIDGEFTNLPEWLAGEPVMLKATADFSFNKFNPATFFENEDYSRTDPGLSKSINLPADMILDINLKIDDFKYRKFSAKNVTGRMTYTPRIVEINNFVLTALSGNISGNCFLTQNSDKSFISKGNFILKEIDINEAFRTFNNFGQTYLKAENIGGSLSGSFTVLSPLDNLMKPIINKVVAEGKYSLEDGELVDFDPVKELSSYIELSELENIKFSNLENEFFISNNSLTMPQMDIKSSAADLSINGKHNFNGDYEYHVKILLSEILSKKKRNSKKTNNESEEFGVIEDDGLGRTSLLLKISQTGSNFKVGYDISAARGALKEDFKNEKQSLKTILNEEYGWFRKDTVIEPQPVQSTQQPRFRINWEDSDTEN